METDLPDAKESNATKSTVTKEQPYQEPPFLTFFR